MGILLVALAEALFIQKLESQPGLAPLAAATTLNRVLTPPRPPAQTNGLRCDTQRYTNRRQCYAR